MYTGNPSEKPKIGLIAGATASGKSSLAMAVAERAGGVIVNADSAQVYSDLRVLSARPSTADEAAVPHRLFGYIDGAEACSAARWARDAKTSLAETGDNGGIPILVGGTGLYLRTLLEGIAPIPDIAPDIRAEVRAMDVAAAYAALEAEDAASAAALNAADSSRIARALEIIRSTGRSVTTWRADKTGGIGREIDLVPLVLLPEREWLYARCDRRFADMFDAGVVEVEALVARQLDPDLPIMRAIGVPEIARFIAGKCSRDEAIAAAQQATRRYAKRQYTWFKHQPPAKWPRLDESEYDSYLDQFVMKLRE
ncbi:MAG: tRNA (adenosine(37)-N6)-dimethylallyltransferase MiaA [Sphingomonadaceae bacterium]|nr:tRNA (adenosine(37)-N6)-dimethylallyltransferase MiaA [Sphingomonadaceae bacterium]